MWTVLCITDADNWPAFLAGFTPPHPLRRIPLNRRSTVVYRERDEAMREAERLCRCHQGELFAVLGLEDVVVAKPEVWASSANGANVVTIDVPRWLGKAAA